MFGEVSCVNECKVHCTAIAKNYCKVAKLSKANWEVIAS